MEAAINKGERERERKTERQREGRERERERESLQSIVRMPLFNSPAARYQPSLNPFTHLCACAVQKIYSNQTFIYRSNCTQAVSTHDDHHEDYDDDDDDDDQPPYC